MDPAAPVVRLARLLVEQQRLAAGAAHALHDQVGPTLTAAGFHLSALGLDREATSELAACLEAAMEAARATSRELESSPAGRLGLRGALEQLGASLPPGAPRLEIAQMPGPTLDAGLARTLYAIACLAIGNAVAHSNASSIRVLAGNGNAGLLLEIADNGEGFDAESELRSPTGTGLALMQAHAAAAELQLTFASTRGNGTIIRIQAV